MTERIMEEKMFNEALEELRRLAKETGLSPHHEWFHGVFSDHVQCKEFYEKYKEKVRAKWVMGTQIIFIAPLSLTEKGYCHWCKAYHD
jgi:hypothetical protein